MAARSIYCLATRWTRSPTRSRRRSAGRGRSRHSQTRNVAAASAFTGRRTRVTWMAAVDTTSAIFIQNEIASSWRGGSPTIISRPVTSRTARPHHAHGPKRAGSRTASDRATPIPGCGGRSSAPIRRTRRSPGYGSTGWSESPTRGSGWRGSAPSARATRRRASRQGVQGSGLDGLEELRRGLRERDVVLVAPAVRAQRHRRARARLALHAAPHAGLGRRGASVGASPTPWTTRSRSRSRWCCRRRPWLMITGFDAGRLAAQAARGDGDAGHGGAPLARQQIGQPRAIGIPEHEHARAGRCSPSRPATAASRRRRPGRGRRPPPRGPATRAPCCRRRGPCPSGKTVIAAGHCRPIGARACMYCAFIPNGCSANTTGAAVFGSPSACRPDHERPPRAGHVERLATRRARRCRRRRPAPRRRCDSSSAASTPASPTGPMAKRLSARASGLRCGGPAAPDRPAAASPSAGCPRCSRCTRTRGCARPASAAGSPAASTAS